MTRYTFGREMQLLCFRATQALTVLGDCLQHLYSAAEDGFSERISNMPFDEANSEIGESQINAYLALKEFVEDKETQAAYLQKRQKEACNG